MSMTQRIIEYIKATITTEEINSYVPNSHVGLVFAEVLEIYQYKLTYKFLRDYLNNLEEYFTTDNPNIEDLRYAYNKLNNWKDPLRSELKLIMIRYPYLMELRLNKNSHDIYKEIINGTFKRES